LPCARKIEAREEDWGEEVLYVHNTMIFCPNLIGIHGISSLGVLPFQQCLQPCTPISDLIFPKMFTPAYLASSSQRAKACSINGFQNPKSGRRRWQKGSGID
jgi:hypothetical protein